MDVISSLPGSITDNILVRLPLEEAVRTSILSREWRYKWTSIPNLVFEFTDSQMMYVKYMNHTKGIHTTEIDAIDHILRHHRGPINQFYLYWLRSPHIDEWIRLLSSSQVHDFSLRIWDEDDKYGLTTPFFAFQNLKHLCLHSCIFQPPPEFEGFCKLVTLNFEQVEYVPQVFDHFLSQSPLLETMRLWNCTDFDAFEVQGPCLRSFTFSGVLNTICFKKCPLLTHVSLSFSRWLDCHKCLDPPTQILSSLPGWLAFLKCLNFPPMMEKLHLRPCALEVTSAAGVPSRFAVNDVLNSLKVLDLLVNIHSFKEVACVFCLLQSSPNLQMLRLTMFAYHFGIAETGLREFIRAQYETDPHLHQLRRVDIELYAHRHFEMNLFKYLLASAVRLEEFVITTPTTTTLLEDVMNQLKQLPRASKTVRAFVKKGDVCIPF